MKKFFKIFIFIAVLNIILPQKAHAYIDPGTGSMLLSVIIAICASLGFFLQSIISKLKFLFGERDNVTCQTKGAIVIYSETPRYWSVFKPILDEFEKREKKVIYLAAKDDDPVFAEDYKFVQSKVIGEGNAAYVKLAFLEADICLMTTPNLDVYQLKRSKKVKHYSHIIHSVSSVVLYRLFGLDYFDSVLTNGSFQEKSVRELEKLRGLKPKEIKVVGCSYLDYLKEKLEGLNVERSDKFTVLLAPSWGKSSLLNKYGEKLIDELVKNKDWNIILRPHPESYKVETKLLTKLHEKYDGTPNLSWDKERDNIIPMSKADILISDFSGIIFDWAFLFRKPFLYSSQGFNRNIYDVSDIKGIIWDFDVMSKIGAEVNKDNLKNIT